MIWAETTDYKHACHLIEVFQRSGIESFITGGGISIRYAPDKLPLVKKICCTEKAVLKTGFDDFSVGSLMKDADGREAILRAAGNGRAIIKEWKE